MKALTFKRYGKSPEVGFAEVPRPTLKPDELLVQVHAASVNPIDNMIPTGLFKAVVKFQLPATLGSDLAGVVVEVGSQVTSSTGTVIVGGGAAGLIAGWSSRALCGAELDAAGATACAGGRGVPDRHAGPLRTRIRPRSEPLPSRRTRDRTAASAARAARGPGRPARAG